MHAGITVVYWLYANRLYISTDIQSSGVTERLIGVNCCPVGWSWLLFLYYSDVISQLHIDVKIRYWNTDKEDLASGKKSESWSTWPCCGLNAIFSRSVRKVPLRSYCHPWTNYYAVNPGSGSGSHWGTLKSTQVLSTGKLLRFWFSASAMRHSDIWWSSGNNGRAERRDLNVLTSDCT